VSGERGNGKVFTFLQDYLDGSVLINGAYCSRRAVLLAVHDMKDKQEAPPALQSKTLSKLDLLNVRPVPQVIFHDDIATAILRMEVVIRLEAMQAMVESKLGTRPVQHIVNRCGSQPNGSSRLPATIRRRSSLKKVRFRRQRRLKLVSLAESPPGLGSFSSPSSSYYSPKSTTMYEAQLRRR
jgi:hypothetical protein